MHNQTAHLSRQSDSSSEEIDSSEEPIRGERLSPEHLEEYAISLAGGHLLSRSGKPGRRRRLLSRLTENGKELSAAYEVLSHAVLLGERMSPAAEWLLDNFYIVEAQLREIRHDLPPGYYYELPRLAEGSLSGYPRVYGIALAIIAHTDSQLEVELLKRFVRAYQSVSPLSIGELWAVPITLRLALVENLRRSAVRTVAARQARLRANRVADRLAEIEAQDNQQLDAFINHFLQDRQDMDGTFLVQLETRLRDQDAPIAQVMAWLERHLAGNQTLEQLTRGEHDRQSAAQATVANIITSMRLLSTLDWQEFFEDLSLVDKELNKDPADAYTRMDFKSRDAYRHQVERIGKRGAAAGEVEVAQKAVDLATEAARTAPRNAATTHVGYYLVGDGLPHLEQAAGYRPTASERAVRAILHNPAITYLGLIALLTAVVITGLLSYAYAHNGRSLNWALLLVALFFFIPASDIALTVVNSIVASILKPTRLSKMDMSKGIPEDHAAFVVVPTLLTDEHYALELVQRMEANYLANEDANLYFALLTDFSDSAQEGATPSDDAALAAAQGAISELNSRYATEDGRERFHLFHRRRQWNPEEGKWMGWERKRGKLEEFNRFLRGDRRTSFVIPIEPAAFLKTIKYVITLDSEIRLPRDTARKLVGTAAHPLNRPFYDASAGRVTKGFGVLQPRIQISIESASKSIFAKLFSGNTGLDPYTTAVSDVYQDLFGEGIYIGKGLYDVDAFEAALAGKVPDNSLLSHDLLEGLFARVGLSTDIELIDDYPPRYDAYVKRQHRWTRGDWQIVNWLLPYVRHARGETVRNRLPIVSKWKIFDNLRRSLAGPSLVVALVAGWTFLPGSALGWTVFALLMLAFPTYARIATNVALNPAIVLSAERLRDTWDDFVTSTESAAFSLTILLYQSFMMTDAVIRVLYRMIFSHRHLLEWMTDAQQRRNRADGLSGFFRLMWPAELLAGIAFGAVAAIKPGALPLAAPFLMAWLASPLVAYFVSRGFRTQRVPLSPEEQNRGRQVARRTWRFFETFVGESSHWLPPDNYQEDPKPALANRTSPTNVGLLLLSTAAARDLGYIGAFELIERLELTFTTYEKLPRFQGHFFNWYDTNNLQPLLPLYISTVDSGNLAGHLIAVKHACLDLPGRPVLDANSIKGLADTLAVIANQARSLNPSEHRAQIGSTSELASEVEQLLGSLKSAKPASSSEWLGFLESTSKSLLVSEDILRALFQERQDQKLEELLSLVGSAIHQTNSFHRDLDALAPWLTAAPSVSEDVIASLPEKIAMEWRALERDLDEIPIPSDTLDRCDTALATLSVLKERSNPFLQSGTPKARSLQSHMAALESAINRALTAAENFLVRIGAIGRLCDRLLAEMDFSFLFNKNIGVFHIGYNVTEGRADNSFYDLLASEARLASFVTIAKGDVPHEHWFKLGRQMVALKGRRALVSWSGTMFEYLMPLLVMRSYQETLLDETYRTVVAGQIAYGRSRGVPWGVSEAAFNLRDVHLNYQYGPFGVPGLGLKTGLGKDIVVSPYSTLLAGMVDPRAAADNLKSLAREGALGRYGYYEAIDYTKDRLPPDQKKALIRAFMAHHQGMILVSIDNILNNQIMQARFHRDPLVQSTELLLQERIPRGVPVTDLRTDEVRRRQAPPAATRAQTRKYSSADIPVPQVQILSNGAYSVTVSTAGSGYSTWGKLAVTRWREDTTRDHWGAFCYLRDRKSGAVWSAGYQPTARPAQRYEVSFSEDKAEISRLDVGIETRLEVIVSTEHNAELRRVSIANHSLRPREIEVTSYAEIVLAPANADAAHPAFGNLFIETQWISGERNALLARRRPRSTDDEPAWAFHVLAVETDGELGELEFETDRRQFLGRGRTVAEPMVVTEGLPLSKTAGAVLDPIFSLRRTVTLTPGQTATLCFTTGAAGSREEAIDMAEIYHDPAVFERESSLAWTRSRIELRHLQMEPSDAHLFQRLAARIVYLDPSLRPPSSILMSNKKTQRGLWAYGISGDLPIILVRVGETRGLDILHRVLRAHEYLHLKGLLVDLVVLNQQAHSYRQSLQEEIFSLIRGSLPEPLLDKPGGIYVRGADTMPEEDRILLETVARVVIVGDRGPLEEQLARKPIEIKLPESFIPMSPSSKYPQAKVEPPQWTFFNGLGGFTNGGREYVIVLRDGQWTPAPWVNVIANDKEFGFQVSETGSGYTWSKNSSENRLSVWSNDPVSDPPSEAVYLRDEETGSTWTPTPLPIRERGAYVITHGQGYTKFQYTGHGISSELLMFAAVDAPVKVSLLSLYNRSDRSRKLSVTAFAGLVLGKRREHSAPFVVTEVDPATGAIFAKNSYNNEFAGRVAFFQMEGPERTSTCDRKEFLGRNGQYARPAALWRKGLSGAQGAGLDPCATIRIAIGLGPGERIDIPILFGEGATKEEAAAVVSAFGEAAAKAAYQEVIDYWDQLLGAVQVQTPDPAMDAVINRWLLYQTVACRLWARSAFYQPGGAYGFRDQLQDTAAVIHAKPEMMRAQILRSAARQFKEGDVQHWWHPATGAGVRTRISDDRLWLPLLVSYYVTRVGDESLLDEQVPFIEEPELAVDQDESYSVPAVSADRASIYEHCVRAIDKSLAVGIHGLPLIGTGDWNDGMNRVGREGRGESIWLGWFLYTVLEGFTALTAARNDVDRTKRYSDHMVRLKEALEESGWDGAWYRRAYFDDGTPLGSAQNDECRIDSIAQSWAVISGAAEPERVRSAMASLRQNLIQAENQLILLLTPPFDKGPLDPGYIKAYVPGVRENGGQYTHAAVWTLIAYAILGDGQSAFDLFTSLNPINHASTRSGAQKYKVEPYVVAADVYALPPHTGRGGWTWYTGSAAWLYRAGVEYILGLKVFGDRLHVDPCIPPNWREYEIKYSRGQTVYSIKVYNPAGLCRGVEAVEVDGVPQPTNTILLADDGKDHLVTVRLGEKSAVEEHAEAASEEELLPT